MNLYIERKQVYGNTLYYPTCERSILLSRLTGTKTFTREHLNVLQLLGYELINHTGSTSLDRSA